MVLIQVLSLAWTVKMLQWEKAMDETHFCGCDFWSEFMGESCIHRGAVKLVPEWINKLSGGASCIFMGFVSSQYIGVMGGLYADVIQFAKKWSYM